MSILGNAIWLFRLFKISCLFIAPFENVMGFFTLKTQIKSPRVRPEPLCVPKFGNRWSRHTFYTKWNKSLRYFCTIFVQIRNTIFPSVRLLKHCLDHPLVLKGEISTFFQVMSTPLQYFSMMLSPPSLNVCGWVLNCFVYLVSQFWVFVYFLG